MSRSKRKGKAPGYEYWARRGQAKKGFIMDPGPYAKKLTHALERALRKRLKLQDHEENDNV